MSTKASSQPQRRTQIALSGTVTKSPSTSKTANSNNAGSNGHPTNANAKADDKTQQKSEQLVSNNKIDIKDQTSLTPTSKRVDKSQNGVSNVNSKIGSSTNNKEKYLQQQQQPQQQQNGNDNKLNENNNAKDKKEKAEKVERKEKFEKEEKQCKVKDKNEKKLKDDKAIEEATVEAPKQETKGPEKKKESAVEEKNLPTENVAEQKALGKSEEKMEIEESIKHSPVPSPIKSKEERKMTSPSTKTVKAMAPTKSGIEKIPQKSETFSGMEKTAETLLAANDKEEPFTADALEMEPLIMDVSPNKSQSEPIKMAVLSPSATSTPGKAVSNKRNRPPAISEGHLNKQFSTLPERPRQFSQISGRRSIRPTTDYMSSKFQSNLQYRESYRRIDTELDTTSSSLNVTVGSEPANNSSFFFFGRGRKRERTPPSTKFQSRDGLSEIEVSPPKKARIDFLSVVYSPITMLRNRFSRASLQSSTPVNLRQKFKNEIEIQNDEVEVQNVSGEMAAQEDLPISSNKNDCTEAQCNNDDEIDLGISTSDTATEDVNKELCRKTQKVCCLDQSVDDTDIQIKETSLQVTDGNAVPKNKRCAIM
uniref:Uncharacterized protein n=1 Tax=Glossina brevipalpis TaxID=37001 RepID=A0A1A9W4F6_9MUSC